MLMINLCSIILDQTWYLFFTQSTIVMRVSDENYVVEN